MGLKTLFDTLTTIKLGQEEWKENKALCFYCQVASGASVASLALAMLEALKGLRKLLGKQ